MKTAGIEICQAGWLLAGFNSTGTAYEIIRDDGGLAGVFDEYDRIFIHIPIGLPDDTATRECDVLLKQKLGAGYTASVIDPPVRAALAAPTYVEANMQNFELTGNELSLQAWRIVPKIRLVDDLLQEKKAWRDKVYESHPEFTFMRMNGGIIYQKNNTRKGVKHRLGLVAREEPDAVDLFREIKEDFRRNEVGEDEIVNAIALANASGKSQLSDIRTLPEPPVRDSKGLKMAVHYI